MADYKDTIIKVVGERVTSDKWKVKTGKHEILLTKGGIDSPSPIQCLLAALAGCLQSIGELVAEEMGITIEDLKVEIEGTFNPGRVHGEGNQRAGLKEIKVKMRIKSSCSDEETLKRWLKNIEERCPVSDNLANPTPIKINFERF
ncbi:MAG: OsmC family protein [Candidatus Omnitrophica bacterium]|nr:OsmC family protein [Candidatus Omnitrophota bacterium]